MKKSLIKIFDKIIIALLAFVGITACSDSLVEYGSPHADYEIKGTITNRQNSSPIKNIRVVNQRDTYYNDTVYTDNDGKYYFSINDYNLVNSVNLKAEDIDGEENGGDFETKEVDITFTNADKIANGSGWYQGKFSKTQNIELIKKDTTE
jgi:putative lipoprotein (rSAM/lipoprotein system)